jgi:hypothetical protein
MARARVPVAGALLCTVLGGCSGLSFHADEATRVVSPAPQARVTLPFTVSWQAPAGAVFAVFVDQAPMPAGRDLRWLARGDSSCLHVPTCPDANWLAAHEVFVSDSGSVQVTAVSTELNGGRRRSDGGHRIAVVRLDGAGRRIGEAVSTRVVYVRGVL